MSRSDTPAVEEPETEPDAEAESDVDADVEAAAGTDGREPISLVGTDLNVGYPTTEEPIVECEQVLLPAGEVTALVGPNGSGKSTLLKALSGQLEPWSGSVEVGGENVYAMPEKRRARRLGLLSQERESPSSLTVEDLVLHGRYPHRGFMEAVTEADREAVERAIDLAGVEHLRGRELGNLSGGQKQLAWIAMTLAQETDVLLLDEPTTFLDLRHQLNVLETVRQLNRERGVTIGVVLHDIAQAARFADNIVALRDGTPYDWGPPDEVVTEDLLADVFGVEASVGPGPEGPTIRPHRALEDDADDG